MEKPRKSIELRKPIYSRSLEYRSDYRDYIDKLAEELSDESQQFDLHIHIDSEEMVPTALALSLSKRTNVDCHAYIGNFETNHVVYSFLSSSSFTTVNLKG